MKSWISQILIFTILVGLSTQINYNLITSCQNCNGVTYSALLQYQGNETHYINLTNPIIQTLNFTYCFITPYQLNIRIFAADGSSWELPDQYPFPYNQNTECVPIGQADASIKVSNTPFSVQVTRKSTGEVIFDTSAGELIFSEYYLKLSTYAATSNIFGLGERAYQLDLGSGGTFTIFNRDRAGDKENGTPGHNTYGYHPVYLQREKTNNFSAVHLRSTNAMNIQILNDILNLKTSLTYMIIGGLFDFNLFLGNIESGDTPPESAIRQYHQFLGGWVLHPLWSLGAHQSRWGYKNVEELTWVLSNYSAHNLPLDVIWSDIDYMQSYVDFTINTESFPPAQMRQMLETYQKRWVPIIDAGIAMSNNPLYNQSCNAEMFIKDPNGEFTQGSVWPGYTNFPDFFNPNATTQWHLGLNQLHQQVPFSGIWLDMNEISNFVDGAVNWEPEETGMLNNPPFVPGLPGEYIYTRTLRMDGTHYGGFFEYYVHATFGMLECLATKLYLLTLSPLTFILSRSTLYGSGNINAHWTGDNKSSFDFLQLSLPGVMNFNIFGIPLVGPDICGFIGETTVELCSRWYQAGTLYPFNRNHNMIDMRSQEPYALGPTVLYTAQLALRLRYSLIKHYYSMFLALNGTGTLFKPVFFEFYEEQKFYDHQSNYVNTQYMVGHSLMVAPVLNEFANSVDVLFPQAQWYNFTNGALIQTASKSSQVITVPNSLNETVPIFLRGGYLVGQQNVEDVHRTDDLDSNFTLVAGLLPTLENSLVHVYYATGPLIGVQNTSDANIVQKCVSYNCVYNVYANFTYTLSGNTYALVMTFLMPNNNLEGEQVVVDAITLYGDWTSSIEFSHTPNQAFVTDNNEKILVKQLVSSNNVLQIIPASPISIYPGRIVTLTGTMEMVIDV